MDLNIRWLTLEKWTNEVIFEKVGWSQLFDDRDKKRSD